MFIAEDFVMSLLSFFSRGAPRVGKQTKGSGATKLESMTGAERKALANVIVEAIERAMQNEKTRALIEETIKKNTAVCGNITTADVKTPKQ